MQTMNSNFKKDKRGGFYPLNNDLFLSSTEILKVIDKPALRYWMGEQVFLAMVQNPNLNKQEALAAPYKTAESAQERGKVVHSMVEAYKAGNKIEDERIPEIYKGYAKAFYRAVDELKLSILEQEKTVYSKTYRYAGTLDMLGRIGDSLPYVIDIKTGKDIYAEAFMQTASYRNCLSEEGIKTAGLAVLLLMDNGNYKWQVCVDDYDLYLESFLAAKTLYHGINKDALRKVGYLK